MDHHIDDDIARAIALSLQESSTPNGTSVIDVDAPENDDEEARFQADLMRAIEASRNETSSTPSVAPATNPVATPAGPSAAPSFLSQRAQMEAERIARLKRRRPDIDPGVHRRPDESDEDTAGEERPPAAKRQHILSSSAPSARRANAYASSTPAQPLPAVDNARPNASGSGSVSQNLFWDGELRQTANKHVDLRKDTRPVFRLSEILAPTDDIDFAIVSAFCWNFPWVYSMFSRRTPVIAVDHSPSGDASIKAILPNWIRTTPFLRNGFGCMHMKFMLLFYKSGRLRVVVSTANLVEYDWRDIENSVWVQDVPKRPNPVQLPTKTEEFSEAMVRVLHTLNVAPALINLLRHDHPNLPLQRLEDLRSHWDFSNVKVALVPSIAGKHEGWPKLIYTGHTGLMKALRNLKAQTPKGKELMLECQGSSIGNYNSMWVNEFYRSARGESTESWLDTPKARRAKVPYPTIRILFPTAQYVRESVLGEAGGGTMFCRRRQWEATNFPRHLFHQTKSKRGRVLMHSKMILGTFVDKPNALGTRKSASASTSGGTEDEPEPLAGWVYVGSHNFTPSAWGTLSGSGFNPILNISNYELGVVIPLRTQEDVDRVACWERPPPKYVDGRDEPWIQTESPCFVEGAPRSGGLYEC